MCSTCGCGDETGSRITTLHDHPHEHSHESGRSHPHDHDHAPDQAPRRLETVVFEREILAKNDLLAADNRRWLEARGITAYNMMSSPGSGKTTLLARTITELADGDNPRSIAVIEGDQETLLDATRIREAGAAVVQINTGAGCHLDADMLRRGLESLLPEPGTLLFIENVGNLVCPALFDLGETAKVVLVSVTEGDDKPMKYPNMFAAADLLVVNKSDLLPYVDFDVASCVERARRLKPGLPFLLLSATSGEGLDAWYSWLDPSGAFHASLDGRNRPDRPSERLSSVSQVERGGWRDGESPTTTATNAQQF